MELPKFHLKKEEIFRTFMDKKSKEKTNQYPNDKNHKESEEKEPNSSENVILEIPEKRIAPSRRRLTVVNNESEFYFERPPLQVINSSKTKNSQNENKIFNKEKKSNFLKLHIPKVESFQGSILSHYTSSIPGESPFQFTKQNQDDHFEILDFKGSNGDHIFAVMDGHGYQGQFVSKSLKEKLPKYIKKYFANGFKIDNIPIIFETANSELINKSSIDCSLSGSTCVIVFINQNRIITANVGDSRAILGSFNYGTWKAKPLSFDHKPSRPDENQRIIESGGRVEPILNDLGIESGPERVWKDTGLVPGLAMSRSMGDTVAASVGVIAQPEITEHVIKDGDEMIILASDGVWEFISNEEAVEIVSTFHKSKDAKCACEALIKEAVARWLQNEGISDDITCTVIFLND